MDNRNQQMGNCGQQLVILLHFLSLRGAGVSLKNAAAATTQSLISIISSLAVVVGSSHAKRDEVPAGGVTEEARAMYLPRLCEHGNVQVALNLCSSLHALPNSPTHLLPSGIEAASVIGHCHRMYTGIIIKLTSRNGNGAE